MNFDVVPIPGQAYEGRQWGWRILRLNVERWGSEIGGSGAYSG